MVYGVNYEQEREKLIVVGGPILKVVKKEKTSLSIFAGGGYYEEYYWDYTWNLYTFLSVTDRKKVGHPKKWLQFHSNNFVESSYLRFEQKKDPIITLIEDPDPELTKEIIQKYCRLINTTPSDFTVTPEHKNKFIQATIKMTEYFSRGKGRIMKAVWVDYLMECMQDIRVNKGEVVYPGNLCSKHTWEELMPQQLKGLGIWAR